MTAIMRWADGVISVAEPPMISVLILVSVAALILPHPGWLEEPFQKDVRWDGVALSTDAGKDVRRLITFSSHVMKLEPLEPSQHFENGVTVSRHLRVFCIKISIYLRYCEV